MKKELQNLTIQDFEQLMQYIRINGIPTDDLEAMNHIADIIGNQTYETLADYLNNVNHQELLFVLKYIWPIADIFSFYNEHSKNSRVYQMEAEIRECQREVIELNRQKKELQAENDNLKALINKAKTLLEA